MPGAATFPIESEDTAMHERGWALDGDPEVVAYFAHHGVLQPPTLMD
jgi:hypothetical protein